MVKVTSKDNGLKALLAALDSHDLTVGIHEAEGSQASGDGDATIAEIGYFHEYGTKTADGEEHIPERSFLRDYIDENESKNNTRLTKLFQKVVASKGKFTATTALNQFGLLAVGEIQKRISEGIPPDLSQETIDRKGSSVPLIDTGLLRSSITHQLKKR